MKRLILFILLIALLISCENNLDELVEVTFNCSLSPSRAINVINPTMKELTDSSLTWEYKATKTSDTIFTYGAVNSWSGINNPNNVGSFNTSHEYSKGGWCFELRAKINNTTIYYGCKEITLNTSSMITIEVSPMVETGSLSLNSIYVLDIDSTKLTPSIIKLDGSIVSDLIINNDNSVSKTINNLTSGKHNLIVSSNNISSNIQFEICCGRTTEINGFIEKQKSKAPTAWPTKKLIIPSISSDDLTVYNKEFLLNGCGDIYYYLSNDPNQVVTYDINGKQQFNPLTPIELTDKDTILYAWCVEKGKEPSDIVQFNARIIGFLFYDVDSDNESGNGDSLTSSSCNWRYLIAAPNDFKYPFGYYKIENECYYVGSTTSGVNGTICTQEEIGKGKYNTNLLVTSIGSEAYLHDTQNIKGIYAAKVCYDYNLNGFSDWFLPSKNELIELYNALASNEEKQKKYNIYPLWYWSSTQAIAQESFGNNLTNTSYIGAISYDFGKIDPFYIKGSYSEYCNSIRPVMTYMP